MRMPTAKSVTDLSRIRFVIESLRDPSNSLRCARDDGRCGPRSAGASQRLAQGDRAPWLQFGLTSLAISSRFFSSRRHRADRLLRLLSYFPELAQAWTRR